jgi:predicted nucleic acid-binding Zn finger protein
MIDQMCYNMPAEVRIAQGCFVFSQQNRSQINSFVLVGRQPCIVARGRKSCHLASAPVGGVGSAGLFAYKGV